MVVLQSANPRALYTTKEACAILGVAERTLRRYVAAGMLRQSFLRSTLRPRYLGADLNKFLQII